MSAVEVYDPAADTWTARSNWRRRDIHCWGAVEIAGKIYVAGSGRESGHVLDVYDPSGDTFIAKTSRPRNVPAYAVAASGGRMYAFGGQRRGGYISAVDVYDPAVDAWAPAGDLPRAKGYAGAAVVDGKIYVMGGVLGKWEEQDASVAEFLPAARIQRR